MVAEGEGPSRGNEPSLRPNLLEIVEGHPHHVSREGLALVGRLVVDLADVEFFVGLIAIALTDDYTATSYVLGGSPLSRVLNTTRDLLKLRAPSFEEEFEGLASRIHKLAEQRNRLVHGSWNVQEKETGEHVASVERLARKGHLRRVELTIEDLQALADEATKLARSLPVLTSEILQVRKTEEPPGD